MFTTIRSRLIASVCTVSIAASFLTRIVLLVKSLPSLELSPAVLLKIFAVGMLFDLVAASYLLIPFALLLISVPDRLSNSRFSLHTRRVFLFVFTFAMLFNGVAEYTFFDEFATRFNFIAVDYLIYTTEVVRNIRESYPVTLIVAVLLLVSVPPFLVLARYLNSAAPSQTSFRRRLAAGSGLLLLPLCSFFCVSLPLSEISSNNYANELAGNGLYGLFSAFRNNELDFSRFYTTRDTGQVMALLRREVGSSDPAGLTRPVHRQGPPRPYNVMLICEESFSAKFMTAFGSTKGITPNLDRLAQDSLLFTGLYATGTRTVRGLEAITLSMPPLPGTAIVKRPGNENLFSLPAVLKRNGYDTRFIYGGHGYFDNMNYFFAHNGADIVDRTSFRKEEITFANAWGVCDGDLFDKAVQQAGVSHAAGKPFFSFVMTTSNHRPYTYPSGAIDIPSHTGRDGGVKYADYAIGRLIEASRKQPWFSNTIFVIVADHCADSARKLALPVKNYEIPMLVYAPGIIKPGRYDRMMSQIDIAPTLLGLLNISYDSRFFGRDVFSGQGRERAFIATYQNMGYMEGDRMVVLSPTRKAEYFRVDRASGETAGIPADEALLLNALAYYQGSAHIYKNRLNRMAE